MYVSGKHGSDQADSVISLERVRIAPRQEQLKRVQTFDMCCRAVSQRRSGSRTHRYTHLALQASNCEPSERVKMQATNNADARPLEPNRCYSRQSGPLEIAPTIKARLHPIQAVKMSHNSGSSEHADA
jgi:hypothetical protein